MYVYCITNKINGKQYIGITNDYKRRWANHIAYQAPEREQVVHRAIKNDAFPQVTPTAIKEALNYHTWKNI